MVERFKSTLYKFINEYAQVYDEVIKTRNFKHSFGLFVRNEMPNQIRENADLDLGKYLIKGSHGVGRWTTVPWIAVFDRRITDTAQKGVYVVYLLNKDKKELYLTLNQGATDVSQNGAPGNDGKLAFTGVIGSSNAKSLNKLRQNALHIQGVVGSVPFNTDEKIKCGAPNYDAGAVCYKKYTLENLPDDQQLFEDLKEFITIYARYAEWYLSGANKTEDTWWPSQEEYPLNLTKEEWKKYILEVELPNHPSPMKMLKGMMELGGEASCKQLSDTYGGHPSAYAGCAMNLGRRVKKYFELPACMDGDQERYFPFPFVGKYRGGSEDNYIYKIRQELLEALNEIDLSAISPYYAEDHNIGKFDSWEIIDETTAIKTCDKSFFEHKGSGVPKDICWFFDAEDIPNGESKSLELIFNGNSYLGKVRNDTTDRRRIQIFWNSDLGNCFEEYRVPNVTATFKKISQNKYEIIMSEEGEKEMTIKEQVSAIRTYIAAKGFNYDGNLIENFYLGLRSKPFVILAGTSGTGKTRLVRLFAEAINAEYKLVSVRPDWSDSSDLFGHVDLNQKFVPGAIIDFVKQAELNPTKPYFLCLDEMNLARVEYYMSDILSAIETRRYEGVTIVTDPIDVNYGNDTAAAGRYGNLILPGNLYIVGTVNMDETTFPFSKKVLDRANTIEFSYVDLLSMPSFSTATVDKITVINDFLVSKYITLNDCDATDRDYIGSVCTTLSRINGILETANAHIGYRVRDEIVFYMLNNLKAELLDKKVAFDNQIMQKILPRVQGSSESIKEMLEELLKICDSEKFEASAKKINFMIKRYEEDGFTSYWL